jgi:hypothetical protein
MNGLIVATELPDKIAKQIAKAGLPTSGTIPFVPQLDTNREGKQVIRKAEVAHGPRAGKRGYVDVEGRIWIKDRAHADVPDHWDVQEDGGRSYFRVDLNGNLLS